MSNKKLSISKELEKEMNTRPCIYVAWSKTTGRAYVGSSENGIIFRKKMHIRDAYKGSKCKFHQALRDLGIKDFVWEIIEILWDNLSIESMDLWLKEKEEYYINKVFNSFKEGYNSSSKGHIIRNSSIFEEEKKNLQYKKMRNRRNKQRKILFSDLSYRLYKRQTHRLHMKRRYRDNPQIHKLRMQKYRSNIENRLKQRERQKARRLKKKLAQNNS